MVNLDNLEGVVLGSLCTFQAGVAFPDRFQGKSSGDMPFIKVSDMKSPRNRYQIREANNWVDVDEAKKMGAKPAPKGSIVFAKIGLGLLNNRFRITTEPTLIDNNMMAAIPNEKISSEELCCIFTTIDMGTWAIGAALPYLRQSDLEKIPLDHLSLDKIESVASIRGNIGLAMDNNSDMISYSEQFSLSLFKSWFIDFEPIIANAEGRILDGMSKESAALFPDTFQEVPHYGKIPSGWRLGSILDTDMAKLIKTGIQNYEGVKEYIDTSCITGTTLQSYGESFDFEGRPSRASMQPIFESVWLAKMDAGTKLLSLTKYDSHIVNNCLLSTGYFGLSPAEPENLEFLHYLFLSETFPFLHNSYSTGTLMSGLNNATLAKIPIVIPPKEIIREFSKITKSILELNSVIRQISTSLVSYHGQINAMNDS